MSKTRYKKYGNATAKEVLEVLQKQWATVNDLTIIAGKCKDNVRKDIQIMKDEYETKKGLFPRGLVPMDIAVKFYNINIAYLKKVCNLLSQGDDRQSAK